MMSRYYYGMPEPACCFANIYIYRTKSWFKKKGENCCTVTLGRGRVFVIVCSVNADDDVVDTLVTLPAAAAQGALALAEPRVLQKTCECNRMCQPAHT